MPDWMAKGATAMKIMTRTRLTSTKGVRLISVIASSLLWPPDIAMLFSLQHHHQARGIDLHLDADLLRFSHKIIKTDDGGYGDGQSASGRDQGLGNTLGYHGRASDAAQRQVAEGFNDPDDGAEESDKRGGVSHSAENPEITVHAELFFLPLRGQKLRELLMIMIPVLQPIEKNAGDRGGALRAHLPGLLGFAGIQILSD